MLLKKTKKKQKKSQLRIMVHQWVQKCVINSYKQNVGKLTS